MLYRTQYSNFACPTYPATPILPAIHRHSMEIGTASWYLLLLILGLATGALLAWIRKLRGPN